MSNKKRTTRSNEKHASGQGTPMHQNVKARNDVVVRLLVEQAFPKIKGNRMGVICSPDREGRLALAMQSVTANSAFHHSLYATFEHTVETCKLHAVTALSHFWSEARNRGLIQPSHRLQCVGGEPQLIDGETSDRFQAAWRNFTVWDFTKRDDSLSEIERIKKMFTEAHKDLDAPLLVVDSLKGIEKLAIERYGPWITPEHRSNYLLAVVRDIHAFAKASKIPTWLLLEAGNNTSDQAKRGMPYDHVTREIKKLASPWVGVSAPEEESDSAPRLMTTDPCDGGPTVTHRIIVDRDLHGVRYDDPNQTKTDPSMN